MLCADVVTGTVGAAGSGTRKSLSTRPLIFLVDLIACLALHYFVVLDAVIMRRRWLLLLLLLEPAVVAAAVYRRNRAWQVTKMARIKCANPLAVVGLLGPIILHCGYLKLLPGLLML